MFWEHYFSFSTIFDDFSDLSKAYNLKPLALFWYQILASNPLQKNKNIDSLDINGRAFLLLLVNSDVKINLPYVMVEYLKKTLLFFHEGNSSFIPYGRVLSKLFMQ